MFATDEALRHLSTQNRWFVDGTFSVAPPLFKQVFAIRTKLGETVVTCCYALLSGKAQELYEEGIEAVLNRCETLGFSPDPDHIHLDFELAIINAFKAKFGLHISTNGCFYHLTQSSWKKIQALGLQEHYKSDEKFKHFCGMVDGLAFLPEHLVCDGMEYLRENAPEAATEFVDYFNSTYVSATYRRVQRPGEANFRLRRIPPLFPVEIWNVHDSTINNEACTNNFCEGWNKSIRETVGHDHPSIWRLIEYFREDDAFVHTQILQSARTFKKSPANCPTPQKVTGQLSTGKLSAGQLSTGQLSTGQLSAHRLQQCLCGFIFH